MSNCYLHHNEESISKCKDCGVGLCEECDVLFEEQVCKTCKTNSLKKEMGFYLGSLIIAYLVTEFIILGNVYKGLNWTNSPFGVIGFFVTFALLNAKVTWIKFKNSSLIQSMWNIGKQREDKVKAQGGDIFDNLAMKAIKYYMFIFATVLAGVGYGIIAFFTETRDFIKDIKDFKLARA